MDNPKGFTHRSYKIPFYHFIYRGEFHRTLRNKEKVFTDGTRVNSFFNQKTFEQYDFEGNFVRFKKAVMFLIHYFPDYRGRDLDNQMYKPVIDSMRKTGILFDDTWMDLSLFLLGDVAKQEKIEVFLVPHHSVIPFMDHVMTERFQEAYLETDIVQTKEKRDNSDYKANVFW